MHYGETENSAGSTPLRCPLRFLRPGSGSYLPRACGPLAEISCLKADKKNFILDGNFLIKSWVWAGLDDWDAEDAGVGAWPPSISLMNTRTPLRLPLTTRLMLTWSIGEPLAVQIIHTGRTNTRSIRMACCPFDSPDIFLKALLWECVIEVMV